MNCTNTLYLGGQNILATTSNSGTGGQYFERTFTNLPAHNMVYFSFTMQYLNGWDYADSFEVQADTAIFKSWLIDHSSWMNFPDLCGGINYKELPNVRTFGRATHSTASLVLKFVMRNSGDSNDESVAFRDIRLLFATTSSSNSKLNTMCALAPVSLDQMQCTCKEGQYYDTSGLCYKCHSLCTSCFGPSAAECYQCTTGAGFDGTACVKCGPSCSVCSGTASNQCVECPLDMFSITVSTVWIRA